MATTAALEGYEVRSQTAPMTTPEGRLVTRLFRVPIHAYDDLEPAPGDTHSTLTAQVVQEVRRRPIAGSLTAVYMVVAYLEPTESGVVQ